MVAAAILVMLMDEVLDARMVVDGTSAARRLNIACLRGRDSDTACAYVLRRVGGENAVQKRTSMIMSVSWSPVSPFSGGTTVTRSRASLASSALRSTTASCVHPLGDTRYRELARHFNSNIIWNTHERTNALANSYPRPRAAPVNSATYV